MNHDRVDAADDVAQLREALRSPDVTPQRAAAAWLLMQLSHEGFDFVDAPDAVQRHLISAINVPGTR